MRLGEPLLAYDIVAEGLKLWPQETRLRQLMALALLRSGAVQQALDVLHKLVDEDTRDEETLGLLARAHKDFANRAADPEAKSGSGGWPTKPTPRPMREPRVIGVASTPPPSPGT